MRIKKLYIPAFIVILLYSCGNLPVYESNYIKNEKDIFNSGKKLPFSHYDTESKIRYDIFHNDSNLYLYFDVSYQPTIRKILNLGLEVYIDTKGKRKKENGFIYPVNRSDNADKKVLANENYEFGESEKISELQKSLNPEFIIIKDDEEEKFNLFSLQSSLKIDMDIDKNNNLTYLAKIPFSLYDMDTLPDRLTIGFMNGEMPEKSSNKNTQNVNMQNTQYNNRMTGNNPVNGNMPYNRMNQNPNTGSSNYRPDYTPVRVWFEITPAKEE